MVERSGANLTATHGLHQTHEYAILGLHMKCGTDQGGATMATLDITRTIDIKAAPEKVWAALTEADLIAQWFGDCLRIRRDPGWHRVLRLAAPRPPPRRRRTRRQAQDPRLPLGPRSRRRPGAGQFDRRPVRPHRARRRHQADASRDRLRRTAPNRSPRTTTTPAAGRPNSANSWSSWRLQPGDRPHGDVPAVLSVLADETRWRILSEIGARPLRQCVGRPTARQQAGHRQAPRRARRGGPGRIRPRRS